VSRLKHGTLCSPFASADFAVTRSWNESQPKSYVAITSEVSLQDVLVFYVSQVDIRRNNQDHLALINQETRFVRKYAYRVKVVEEGVMSWTQRDNVSYAVAGISLFSEVCARPDMAEMNPLRSAHRAHRK
jgi:hypothetical protein